MLADNAMSVQNGFMLFKGIIRMTIAILKKSSLTISSVCNCRSVSAIIFCASISAYNQTLEESPLVNRMEESLRLFEGITGYKWFGNTPIILFLNKIDLFEEKLATVPLRERFADYEPPPPGAAAASAEQRSKHAADFIRRKFEAAGQKSAPRKIHTHFTQATDQTQIQFVFDVVRKTILERALQEAYTM